jgi:Domain of unknown function (DUF4430)
VRGARSAFVGAVLAAVALASGCGLGAGKGTQDVQVVVTRDFGTSRVGQAGATKAAGGETVMRFLQRHFRVTTRFGGGFVQSIDGLAGSRGGDPPLDWFYYVNGIEAGVGAADTRLHAGDRVWWDRHDWGAAMRVPAVVGSFPEPFRSGSGGKRYPVRIECAHVGDAACDAARDRLRASGVPDAAVAGVGGTAGRDLLRVLVGPWRALRGDPALQQLQHGPSASGVYARPAASGASIAVLDVRGRTVGTLGAGAGLVAATRLGDQQPTWAVTGVDEAGALGAARALGERSLRDRFAAAVSGGKVRSVP